MLTPDFHVICHGSLVTFTPVSEQAREWWDDNVATGGWQWMGNACCVEPRCAEPIINGILEEGMTIQ
jgi:hypothetical protein